MLLAPNMQSQVALIERRAPRHFWEQFPKSVPRVLHNMCSPVQPPHFPSTKTHLSFFSYPLETKDANWEGGSEYPKSALLPITHRYSPAQEEPNCYPAADYFLTLCCHLLGSGSFWPRSRPVALVKSQSEEPVEWCTHWWWVMSASSTVFHGITHQVGFDAFWRIISSSAHQSWANQLPAAGCFVRESSAPQQAEDFGLSLPFRSFTFIWLVERRHETINSLVTYLLFHQVILKYTSDMVTETVKKKMWWCSASDCNINEVIRHSRWDQHLSH